ncbi:hypothetical protein [Rickettsia helvetica]|uniref:Uncharacterized protein n=1 Tax=Rickettsia helvetica TaxID=35789 RepID=A0ABP0T3V1_RICHE|nr:hypothetical protein [Rickettsia helvetica]MCZ6884166.1 hypothetical protein [Rickettsia endosymbiont of Ixodes ricinus]MCZ6896143.1 hypothetical protein [Rickettsia endosymbiont of Ixodes ricinus]
MLGNSKNRKKFIERFWDIRNEKDNNKSKTFTMRQYLNKDHTPVNYKPEYCKSPSDLKNKWVQECQEFKELHKKITGIYDAIDIVITQNQAKKYFEYT